MKSEKPPLVYEIARNAGGVEDFTVQAYTWYLRKCIEELQVSFMWCIPDLFIEIYF